MVRDAPAIRQEAITGLACSRMEDFYARCGCGSGEVPDLRAAQRRFGIAARRHDDRHRGLVPQQDPLARQPSFGRGVEQGQQILIEPPQDGLGLGGRRSGR